MLLLTVINEIIMKSIYTCLFR